MTNSEYRKMLIDDILEFQTRNQYTKKQLEKKPISVLEEIYDIID